MRRTSCSPNPEAPSRLLPPSSTRRRVSSPAVSCTASGGVPCWNALVISSFATIPSFCAVEASSAIGGCVDDDRHGNAIGDAAQECACIDAIFGFREQPVHGRDRADACGSVIKRLARAAVGAAEQQQIGDGLQIVLDPVICFPRERALEVCASGGSAVSGRLTANRADEDERDSDGSCEQSEPHRCRAGREGDERGNDRACAAADGEPEPAAPTNLHYRDERNGEEKEEREARAARNDEQRDEGDQPSRPKIEQQPPTT